jgi:hypothetical protein
MSTTLKEFFQPIAIQSAATAADRKKYGMKTGPLNRQGQKKFPIANKSQAESALHLRYHAKPPLTKQELENLYRRAARFAPEAVKRAREADKKR